MASVVTIIVGARANTTAAFARVRAQAARLGTSVQSSFGRMNTRIMSGLSSVTSAFQTGFTRIGALAGQAASQIGQVASALSDSASSAGGAAAAIGKWVAVVAVAVHALPAVIDLLGVIQLVPAAILAGGLAMATFTLATHGMGDAIKEALTDFEKWNKSSSAKGMTRWTHDFVAGVVAIRDALKPLRRELADRLFKELGADLVELKVAHFPAFEKWTKRIATSMNEGARALGNWLKEPAQIAAVEAIFRNLSGTIDSLMGTLKPLGQIFMDIATVGAPRLASASSTLQSLVEKAAEWVHAMKESGRLGAWLDRAMDGFTTIRGIIGDLAVTIGNFYSAATGQGKPFLDQLKEMSAALREWSATDFGEQTVQDLAKIGSGLVALSVIVVQSVIGWIAVMHRFYDFLNQVLLRFLDVVGGILHAAARVEQALGFGNKLQKAAQDFDDFRDRANRALAGIEDEDVNVNVIARLSGNGAGAASDAINRLSSRATGGVSTGLTKVGEHGAELVDFGARGGRTYNHGQSQRMLSGAAGGGGTTVVINVPSGADSVLASALLRLLRVEIHDRGGNVQTVLGG